MHVFNNTPLSRMFVFETSGYDQVSYIELHNQIVALYIFVLYSLNWLEPLWPPKAGFEGRKKDD